MRLISHCLKCINWLPSAAFFVKIDADLTEKRRKVQVVVFMGHSVEDIELLFNWNIQFSACGTIWNILPPENYFSMLPYAVKLLYIYRICGNNIWQCHNIKNNQIDGCAIGVKTFHSQDLSFACCWSSITRPTTATAPPIYCGRRRVLTFYPWTAVSVW